MTPEKKLQILMIITIVLIVGGIVAAVILTKTEATAGAPKMATDSTNYNFGKVSMVDGLVKHNFIIRNDGDGDLRLSNIKTSCMCTTAVLIVDGQRSQSFGMHDASVSWSKKIKPGQSAELEITFDPNAHGPDATGPITREITMYSNDGGRPDVRTKFVISADVIK